MTQPKVMEPKGPFGSLGWLLGVADALTMGPWRLKNNLVDEWGQEMYVVLGDLKAFLRMVPYRYVELFAELLEREETRRMELTTGGAITKTEAIEILRPILAELPIENRLAVVNAEWESRHRNAPLRCRVNVVDEEGSKHLPYEVTVNVTACPLGMMVAHSSRKGRDAIPTNGSTVIRNIVECGIYPTDLGLARDSFGSFMRLWDDGVIVPDDLPDIFSVERGTH